MLPARSVIVVATVAANDAGRARALVLPIVTVSELASAASCTVLETAAPPAVTLTEAFETVAGATGSEKVTTSGVDKLTELAPRSGASIVIVGGVWSTVIVTGAEVTFWPATTAVAEMM